MWVALLAGVSSGCSTVATLIVGAHEGSRDCSETGERLVPRVYSGVFYDVAMLRSGAEAKGLIVLDLPFSLVADTVVLPYTVYTQIRHGNLCPNDDAEVSEGEQKP